ncbi:MAG TPA: ABC transporter substrate-binding protein [Solirubrobacter sp.]|nr:ABC transporter substrate-binding protein [Solirubrobacter sp.]
MRTRWIQFLAVGAACAALGVGCGGDDEEPASSGGGSGQQQQEAVTLKVGVIPIADVAPLYLGIKKGFFEEENLTIQPQLAEGGAAIIPSVMSGDYQIGFSNAVSLLIAASKDLPVQIISQGVLGGASEEEAWDAVVLPKGSDVKTAKDLEGKTIAVNTLNNIGPVTINSWLEKNGADYKKVKYVEVPFPDMGPALAAKRVDAAFTVEPAYSGAVAGGGTPLFSSYVATAPNLTVATYFASKQYIAENKDIVERFQRAMTKSLEYAAENDQEVRDVVKEYTEIPPEVIDKIHLPTWKADLNEPTIKTLSELSLKYGFIEEEPDLNELILRD